MQVELVRLEELDTSATRDGRQLDRDGVQRVPGANGVRAQRSGVQGLGIEG